MKKIVFLLLFLPIQLFAQFEIGMFSTPSQQMVENAVKSSMFLSKQSFQIRDKKTDELFGLNGKKEFGVQYALGVKIKSGILLVDKVVRPWLYDSRFEKYKENYDPILYQATYTEQGEKVNYQELNLDTNKLENIFEKQIYSYPTETFEQKGLMCDYTAGTKKGWIIWVTADSNTDFEVTSSLNYTIYQKDLIVSKEQNFFGIEKPKGQQKILGGIYVVPYYMEIGVVEFKLCGLIVPDTEITWKICCPFIEHTDCQVESTNETGGESELTPIGKNNKDKNKKKDRK